MIYLKEGSVSVDEVPITLMVGGALYTISENEIAEAEYTFNTVEEYYTWAAANVDGFGDPNFNNTNNEVFPTLQKLYFATPEERDAFNAAEAEFAGADPSLPYLEVGQDAIGYYLLVDVIAKPSLWERFKSLF